MFFIKLLLRVTVLLKWTCGSSSYTATNVVQLLGRRHAQREAEAPDLRHHQRPRGHRPHWEEEQKQYSVEVSQSLGFKFQFKFIFQFDVVDGGSSGRATAFRLGRPGSNSVMDLGFFSSELLSIYSHRVLGSF